MDVFDIRANACCDCEELTDFKFDSVANKFCDSEELVDFHSKILRGIGFSHEGFEQGQPAKLVSVCESWCGEWDGNSECCCWLTKR